MKDPDFYTRESTQYSQKRYPAKAKTYVQYFFKDRLSRTLKLVSRFACRGEDLTLLEVGCADGIVLRALGEAEPDRYGAFVGIDTAPGMIAVAKQMTVRVPTNYYVRGEEPDVRYDVIVEVGVANYTDFETELVYASEHLLPAGIYVLSIAGSNSTNACLGYGVGYENCWTYATYERIIREKFTVVHAESVGLFVPFLWRLPLLARALQSLLEGLLRPIFPNLFHEKVYVLQKTI